MVQQLRAQVVADAEVKRVLRLPAEEEPVGLMPVGRRHL
jgi:hypothetical protein